MQRRMKRELRNEAVERRGGACVHCQFRKGNLIILFPPDGKVMRVTGDNASVRVVCGALGEQQVRTAKVVSAEHCGHYQRKLRRAERERALKTVGRMSLATSGQA